MRAAVSAGCRSPATRRRRRSSSSLTGCARRPQTAAGNWITSISTVMTVIAAPAWAGRGWTGRGIMRRWLSWMSSWWPRRAGRLARELCPPGTADRRAGRLQPAGAEFLDRPMSDDPHDQLLLQIRGAVAENERTLVTERMWRGGRDRPGGDHAAGGTAVRRKHRSGVSECGRGPDRTAVRSAGRGADLRPGVAIEPEVVELSLSITWVMADRHADAASAAIFTDTEGLERFRVSPKARSKASPHPDEGRHARQRECGSYVP
jgi:hypothetical protein